MWISGHRNLHLSTFHIYLRLAISKEGGLGSRVHGRRGIDIPLLMAYLALSLPKLSVLQDPSVTLGCLSGENPQLSFLNAADQ